MLEQKFTTLKSTQWKEFKLTKTEWNKWYPFKVSWFVSDKSTLLEGKPGNRIWGGVGYWNVRVYTTEISPITPPKEVPKETIKYWVSKGYSLEEASKISTWVKFNKRSPTDEKIKEIIKVVEVVVVKEAWYTPIVEGLKNVGRKFIEVFGETAYQIVATIHYGLTGKEFTREMATDFARKYGEWWPMTNFLTVVLYGKNTKGEPQTELGVTDWVDLILLLAPLGIVTIEKFWGNTAFKLGNKGMATITKSGLSKWDKIYAESVKKGVSPEVLNAVEKGIINAHAAEIIKTSAPTWQKFMSIAPKAIKVVVGAFVGIIGYTTFAEWSAKEAGVEISTFPIWVLIDEEKWKEAKEHLPSAYKSIENAENVINSIAWLNLHTKEMWLNYAKEARTELVSYAKLIDEHVPEFLEIPEVISGDVTSVIDGDTIDVTDMLGHVFRVRLIGIDAPEFKTTEGKASAKFLTDQIHGKRVNVKVDPNNQKDKYDRALGVVFLNGVDINKLMLTKGYAQCYFIGSSKYYSEEDYKEAAKRRGKIKVTSKPSYCEIWIDQKNTLKQTSETFEMPEDSYVFSCSKEGYITKSENVTIIPDQTIEIRFELEKSDLGGEVEGEVPAGEGVVKEKKENFTIEITSTPANAKIYIDDQYTHHWTPANEKELKDVIGWLSPGKHIIKATKGGMSAKKEITISEGRNETVYLLLETVGLPKEEEEEEEEIEKEGVKKVPVEVSADIKALFDRMLELTEGRSMITRREVEDLMIEFGVG